MPERRYTSSLITQLLPNQVFVFGSNRDGFHGAGAAGLACRGIATNDWRQDKWFLQALEAPIDSRDRVGFWAILGVGVGYQQGILGASYAIVTVSRPGARRSIPLCDILLQLKNLGIFARQHPELEFLSVVQGGGYNGYTQDEFRDLYQQWVREDEPPHNILFPEAMRLVI